MADTGHGTKHSKARWAAIVFGMVLPTLVTWVYFYLLDDRDSKVQQMAYSIGKGVQFAFPLVWICLLLRLPWHEGGIGKHEPPTWSAGRSNLFGIAMGIAVVAAMFLIQRNLPADIVESLTASLQERVKGFGFSSPLLFIGLGTFYALVHSFLEEYYYRWFIFAELRKVTGFWPSCVLSGFAFMGHHVIVLAKYFGATSFLTIFLSLCIAIGGMIWAWQYERSRSLIGPWISHLVVDAGIFAVGYQILF